MTGERPRLAVIDAGLLPYDEAFALQLRLHAKVVTSQNRPEFSLSPDSAVPLPPEPAAATALAGYLLVVEHPPVLTLGKHASRLHLRQSEAEFAAAGVAVLQTERGGEVTAHMPGQLVIYPVLSLPALRLSPRTYVAHLEQAVIATLAQLGVVAYTDPQHPGVWTAGGKICAVGIRIKNRVSLHGLALNVDNSLDLFSRIVPCGIAGRLVTSITQESQAASSVAEVAPVLVEALIARLGAVSAGSRRLAHLQWEEGVSTI